MVVGSPAHKKAVQSLWVGKATITVLDGVLNPANGRTEPQERILAADIRCRMHANVEQIENYKFAASPRFKGEDGKPMLWEICCISADEYARIRNSCVRQVPVPGKKGQYTQQLDSYAFQAKVCARCTVFPDLSNAELQNDWGVAKPEELLGKLLIGGEFDDYVTEVFQLNGFKTENELVDEAKN